MSLVLLLISDAALADDGTYRSIIKVGSLIAIFLGFHLVLTIVFGAFIYFLFAIF